MIIRKIGFLVCMLVVCSLKLRKECNLLEMSVG